MTGDVYDVVVAGGGPAGLATAVHLCRDGWGVLVVEHTDYTSPRVGEHLAPSAKALLAELGLADILADGAHASSPGVRSAWGAGEPVDKDYLFDPHGEGVNLSRPRFDRSLAAHATGLGVRLLTRTKVADLARGGGNWRITLAGEGGPAEVAARFIIDATGRPASLAKRLGARPIVHDELVGLVGHMASPGRESAIHAWVLIEAQETGWWYSAGLTDGTSIATFLTDPDLTNLSLARRAGAWRTRLAGSTLTRDRIGAGTAPEGLHVRSARTQRLDRMAGDGWLAVGDAAMSFDPLSSEGISKGLQMGRTAAVAAAAACRGDARASADYERNAQADFGEYLAARRSFYAAEGRWRHAPFWRRRREAAPSMRA